MDNVAAIILAGGKSSRMGSDKASLMLNEKRLIDHVAEVISAAGISNIYASGKVEGFSSIPDAVGGQPGPVAGICSAVTGLYSGCRTLVFIPVDMPLITPAVIKYLLEGASHSFACHFEKRPLPFAMRISSMALRHSDSMLRHMSEGMQFSVWKFLEPFRPLQIKCTDELVAALTNANTPEEWKRAAYESAD